MPDQREKELLQQAVDGPRDRLDAVIVEANRWLADPSATRRKVGLEVLGHVSEFRGYRPSADILRNIVDCARDPEAIVRAETACALSLVSNAPVAQRTEVLLRLLDDDDERVREEAAAAIGDLRLAGAAADRLAAHLEDPAMQVRVECAIALGRLRDPRALEVLIAVLDRPWDRIYASRALAELGDPRAIAPLQALASRWRIDFSERLHALGALYRLGDLAAGAKIIERTRAWNRAERHVAFWMIGHARVADGVELLFEVARDRRHKMRDAAIGGLGELDDSAAVGVLAEIARDSGEDVEIRLDAVKALSEVRSEARRRALEGIAAAVGDGVVAEAARLVVSED